MWDDPACAAAAFVELLLTGAVLTTSVASTVNAFNNLYGNPSYYVTNTPELYASEYIEIANLHAEALCGSPSMRANPEAYNGCMSAVYAEAGLVYSPQGGPAPQNNGGIGVADFPWDDLWRHLRDACDAGLQLLLAQLGTNAQAQAQERATDTDTDDNLDIAYRNPDPERGEHPAALIIGFRAKAPDNFTRGPAFHITHGSTYPTRFISLTKSLERARRWQTPGIPIYMINLNQVIGIVLDFTILSVVDEYLRGSTARSIAINTQEVLVEGWIPPAAIKALIP
jgi:hypothetical protein